MKNTANKYKSIKY